MRFEQVLPALRDGKKVRRADWPKGDWVSKNNEHRTPFHTSWKDLINSDDWEIVADPLTDEQLIAAWEKAAGSERETFSKSYGSDYEAARRAEVFALCASQLRERKL